MLGVCVFSVHFSGDLANAMWRHNILTQLPERHTEDDPEVQEDPRPFELNANGQSSLIEFTKDRRTATYLGSSHQGSDVGIQSTLPVPRQVSVYYFEMTVLEKGEKGRTTLGFTVKDSKLTSQPGWVAPSHKQVHNMKRPALPELSVS